MKDVAIERAIGDATKKLASEIMGFVQPKLTRPEMEVYITPLIADALRSARTEAIEACAKVCVDFEQENLDTAEKQPEDREAFHYRAMGGEFCATRIRAGFASDGAPHPRFAPKVEPSASKGGGL